MSIEELISHRLDSLKETGDDKLFENVCIKCIEQIVNHKKTTFKHAGNVYGGDGGVDGFILNGNYSNFRIACSISSDWENKLKNEASHINSSNYDGLFFCSSKEINQRDAEKRIKELQLLYKYKICIIAKSHIAEIVEDLHDCLELLGIPAELNKLEIKHLAKHNQFKNEIGTLAQYIPRRIVQTEDTGSLLFDDQSILISDFIKEPPIVTVMLSPAGFGKTGALKQACNHILMNPEEYDLPPVYLKVSNYYAGALYNRINDIVGTSPDYELRDALLFLDGIDEISDESLKALVDDLCSWISNTSFIRKLFFAGRTNEFNIKTLNPLGQIKMVHLKKPTSEELLELINSRLERQEDDQLVNNYILNNFYDANLFFIDKAIVFFKTKGKIPSALWELLDYVALQDVRNILRQDDPDLQVIEKEAFDAIRMRKDELSVYKKTISLDSFSHRYVVEYLAAKYLSCLPTHVVEKKVLAAKEYILPWLKNTVGIMLSLVAENEEKDKLHFFFISFTKVLFNVDALIKCDSQNLNKELKTRLIRVATDYVLKSLDVYSMEKDYCRLFFDPLVKEANLTWLKSRIENEQDVSNLGLLFHIVFYHCLNNGSDIPKSFEQYLKQKLFAYFDKTDSAKYYGVIASILYSLASLPDSGTFTSYEISKLIDFIANKYWKHECFNNTCRIIAKTDRPLPLSEAQTLLNVYFQISDFTRKRSGAYSVPRQIDDDFNPIPMEFQHTDDYYPLIKKQFVENPELLWSTMHQAIQTIKSNTDSGPLEEKEEKLLKALAESITTIQMTNELTENKISLVLSVFMISPYAGNSFRLELLENAPMIVGSLFLRILDDLNDSENRFEYQSVFRPFVSAMAKDSSLFLDVVSKQKLNKDDFENKIQIFNYIDSVDSGIFSVLSDNSKERVRQNIALREAYESNRKTHEELVSSSVHQLFDTDTFIVEIRKIFSEIGKTSASINEIINAERRDYSSPYNNELSPIAIFFLKELLHKKEILSQDTAINTWVENQKWRTVALLVNYMENHNLDYSLLNKEEQDFIKKWTVETIKKYPVSNGNETLRYLHVYLSILMNDSFMGDVLKESVYPLREQIKGFISIGIIRMLHSGAVDPKYASIDYLRKFFSDSEIISNICSNINHILGNNNSMYGIGEYLSAATSDESIKLHGIGFISQKFKEHISLHFSVFEYEFISFYQFFDNAGITADTFPMELYLSSLKFNEDDQRYEENHASYFLKIFRPCTAKERTYINMILKKRFSISTSIKEKKYIAEYMLMYDHSYHKSFNWYAKMLLKDDSTTINEFLTHNENHYCNSPLCLSNLKKLWEKYEAKNGEKSLAIKSIVSNSIISIIRDSRHKRFTFPLIMLFIANIGKSSDSYNILRLKQRCIIEFINCLESQHNQL